jgi:hypothetical protein
MPIPKHPSHPAGVFASFAPSVFRAFSILLMLFPLAFLRQTVAVDNKKKQNRKRR